MSKPVDPNADLIGYQYTRSEGTPAEETVTVKGTPRYKLGNREEWMHGYVTIRFATGHETIANAHAIRQGKEANS